MSKKYSDLTMLDMLKVGQVWKGNGEIVLSWRGASKENCSAQSQCQGRMTGIYSNPSTAIFHFQRPSAKPLEVSSNSISLRFAT